MSKLFLGENKFQLVKIKWSNPRMSSGRQQGNVRIVFMEVAPDSSDYKTEMPPAELDPWSPIQSQLKRENFVANVVIDDKLAFACTVSDLLALQRAIESHVQKAQSYLY